MMKVMTWMAPPCVHSLLTIVLVLMKTIDIDSVVNGRGHNGLSSEELRELARWDFEVWTHLQNWKKQERNKATSSPLLKAVDKYLKDFATSSSNNHESLSADKHAEAAVENPLSMFRLIQRLAHFLRSKADRDIPGLPAVAVQERLGSGSLPLKDDLLNSVERILWTHYVYDLNITQLASGKVKEVDLGIKLHAINCFFIGIVAKNKEKFSLGIEWLREAKRRAKIDGTVDIPTVQAELVHTIRLHDHAWYTEGSTNEYLFWQPLESLDVVDRGNINKMKDALQAKCAGKERNDPSCWSSNFLHQCAGPSFFHLKSPTTKESSHLFCWLEFKVNKVFNIGPLKIEFLSRNPDIIQVYEAFTEKEVKDARIFNGATNNSSNFDSRTRERIHKKMEAITGLRSKGQSVMNDVEVVDFLPGHHSKLGVGAEGKPSQFSTLMIHLNTVEEGGQTVFPAASATASPIIGGSAIFWYNVLSEGSSPDFSTVHADCPVILGQKSILLERTGFHDQLSGRKSLLNPTERFRFPVNGKFLPIPNAVSRKVVEPHEYYNSTLLLTVRREAKVAQTLDFEDKRRVLKYAYSSVPALKSLIRLELAIYKNLKEILAKGGNLQQDSEKTFKENENLMRSYVLDFNETIYEKLLSSAGDPTYEIHNVVNKLAQNPLSVYRTMWRFENYVKKWATGEPQQEGKSFRQFRQYLDTVYSSVNEGPSRTDLEDATVGILTIQHIYDLKSEDIARGIVKGTDVGIILTARQCIQLGQEAITRSYYNLAVDWMQVAVNKVAYDGNSTAELDEAQLQLGTSIRIHDILMAREYDTGAESSFYASPISGASDSATNLQTKKQAEYEKYKFRSEIVLASLNLWGICQGKSHQTAEEKKGLFCWYERGIHGYWKIGPIKAEILSLYPKSEVVLFHEVLTPHLQAFLSTETNDSHILPAVRLNPDPKQSLSAAFWMHLHNSDAPKEAHVVRKLIERITGLKLVSKGVRDTALQISSYTPGCHILAHRDTVDYDTEGEYARIATLMFYLSDVEEGGETGFSQSGVRIRPKKGSAAFWMNTLSSGGRDDFTTHGSCPVIFGEKLVATQWIHYADQHHMQCDPDSEKRIEILVNGKSKYGNWNRKYSA